MTARKQFEALHRELRVTGPGGLSKCLPWNVRQFFAAWAAIKWTMNRHLIGNEIRHELNIWRNEHDKA